MTGQGQGILQLLLLVLALSCIGSHAKLLYVDGSAGSKCLMSDGVAGICREARDCLALNGIMRRNGIVHRCSTDSPTDIYVCCRQPAHITKTLCSAWSKFWRQPGHGESEARCLNENPLVIGGAEAPKGEFKHIVLVGKKIPQRKESIAWICGGTLISPHFVLTAAHCITSGKGKFFVRLGEHDTRSDDNSQIPRLIGEIPKNLFKSQEINQSTNSTVSIEQTIEVEVAIRHPKYRLVPKYHDIGLLRLKEPIVLTTFVLPACLPSDDHTLPSNGDTLHAAGWGRTAANQRGSSPILQKVDLPKIDNKVCSLHFQNLKKELPLGITKDMMCAGELGKDTCKAF